MSTPSLVEMYRFSISFLSVRRRKRKRNRDGRKRRRYKEKVKVCESEGVQGVLTLFCSGAAQACHHDRAVELKEQLEVEEEDGDRQEEEEEVEVEREKRDKEMRR